MDNPIVQRLQKMTDLWLEFTVNQEARICRWLVREDELSMIKTFYRYQSSEGNDTGDLFIQLNTAFKKPADYALDLRKEFLNIVNEIREETEEADIKQWKPFPLKLGDPPVLALLKTLDEFAQCLKLPEGFLVIFLQPSSLKGIKNFKNWVVELLDTGIPKKVRFMLVDSKHDPELNELCEEYPELLYTITPDLKMNAAVNELANAGDPADPGVQFRKAFVHLTQAIGKQDMNLVEKTAGRAFGIAAVNNWPHMKVAVNMAKAGAFLGKKNYDKAYKIYGEAFQHSDKAYQEGDEASGKLAVTTLFSQGASMISAKKYDIALQSYTDAIPYAEETDDNYNLMEAWRMSGHCHQQLKEHELAWDAYWQALEFGAKLDEQLRPNSTLPFVGKELLILAKKLKQKEQIDVINDRMVELVGEDWIEKTKVS